jgi:CheY-like chemotaxis protein
MVKTLLIVEDQAVTREALALVCRSEGYRVLTAASGQEALGHLRGAAPPSVVLFDVRVAAKDGERFLEQRRRDAALASVPLVLITERGADPRWLSEPGLAGTYPKPVPLDGLFSLLQRCG